MNPIPNSSNEFHKNWMVDCEYSLNEIVIVQGLRKELLKSN